jgi:hypothetical protein
MSSGGIRLIPPGSIPCGGWTIFCGDANGLAGKVTELLQEQTKLLETTNLFSRADLDSYERRSEQIRELIELLAEG